MRYTIGTAGHIDHGKTTLVRALTGMETDTLKEEKKRGLSINLGFAHFEAVDESVGAPVEIAIIDVPGHERFIKNMLAGTTGIDSAVLVVAADDGVMPQTREHVDIITLLGITNGVVALTKCDVAGVERIAVVKKEIAGLLKGTTLETAPTIEVSGITGAGIEALKRTIVSKCVESRRRFGGPFMRLPIDRSFTIKGFGAVLTGTIASGRVSIGDELKCFPDGRIARVRGIESLHKSAKSADTGERAAINLKGESHNDFSRGMVIASPGLVDYAVTSLPELSTSKKPFALDCVFEFARSDDAPFPIKDQTPLNFFHQTSERNARIRFVDRRRALKGERVYGRLFLDSPALALRGDRFILRDTSKGRTIGGGKILLPHFSRSFLKKLAEVDFTALDNFDPGNTLALITSLFRKDETAISLTGLEYVLNVARADLQGHLKAFGVLGRWLARPEMIVALKKSLIATLSAFHKTNPAESGLDENILYTKAGLRVDAEVYKEIIEALIKDAKISRQGALLKLAEARPELPGADMKIKDAILSLFKSGINAIGDEDLRTLGLNAVDIKRVLSFLLKGKILVRIAEGRYVTEKALSEAREKLVVTLRARGKAGIKASEYRDVIGTGRKIAIELLEYFDNERITLRHGDIRTLRENLSA